MKHSMTILMLLALTLTSSAFAEDAAKCKFRYADAKKEMTIHQGDKGKLLIEQDCVQYSLEETNDLLQLKFYLESNPNRTKTVKIDKKIPRREALSVKGKSVSFDCIAE